MPAGAVAAIKHNVSKSTFKRGQKIPFKSSTSGNATALRGGHGPVRQDIITLPNKVNA